MKIIIIYSFIFSLFFFNSVLAQKNEQITFDLPKEYSYTKNNPITFTTDKFQIGSIKTTLLTSINSTEYDMSKSNLTYEYSFKDYGYKRKWIINATKPLLTTVSIDYFKFSMEGCIYYNEYVFHCGNIELDFQDLVDSGYDVMIVNESVIVKSSVFNTLNKIYLDPTDRLLPNSTNKAYLISSTQTYNPSLALTEFTSTQYINVNTSNDVYVTSTAQETITASCTATGTASCEDAGYICFVNSDCLASGSGCTNTCPSRTSATSGGTGGCSYSYSTCQTCTSRKCKSSYSCSLTGSYGNCTYTCDNGYYDTDGTDSNGCEDSVYSGIYTFQRFSFNMSNYTSGMDNATFCYEGKYASAGGSSSGGLLWYNITSGLWLNSTSISTTEGTNCIYFDAINMTNLFNATTYYANFSAMGNQSKTGHALTLSSDYAYVNVSWTEFIPTTTTVTPTTTTPTTTVPTTTTTIQPTAIKSLFECERKICYENFKTTPKIIKIVECDLEDEYPYFLIFEDTKDLLWEIVCEN